MIKTVIFDMDGVIIDSEPMALKVERRLFAEFGIRVSRTEHETFIGTPVRQMWIRLKKKHRLRHSVDAILAMGRRNYREYLRTHEPPPPVPGVKAFIRRLRRRGLELAIASSSSRKTIRAVCRRLELGRFFSAAIGGDDVSRWKPAPDIFLRAAAAAGSEPAQCLVIEDSHNGVIAAKRAGMRCVGLRNPGSGRQDLSDADVVVDSFAELAGAALDSVLR